jgi:hypothetical protein
MQKVKNLILTLLVVAAIPVAVVAVPVIAIAHLAVHLSAWWRGNAHTAWPAFGRAAAEDTTKQSVAA